MSINIAGWLSFADKRNGIFCPAPNRSFIPLSFLYGFVILRGGLERLFMWETRSDLQTKSYFIFFFHQPTFFPPLPRAIRIFLLDYFNDLLILSLMFALHFFFLSAFPPPPPVRCSRSSPGYNIHTLKLHAYMKSRCVSDRVMILISLYSFSFLRSALVQSLLGCQMYPSTPYVLTYHFPFLLHLTL